MDADRDIQIEVRDLTMAYGDFVIQRDLNFTINRGEVFIIMGGSGCGKSTLLKIMIGLKSPAKGDVIYDGVPFWAQSEDKRELMKRNFGTSFQAGALWSSMTLAENIALPLSQYTELTDAEMLQLMQMLTKSQRALTRAINPQGFNVGINLGRCAGAGLPGHLHFHIVPRWQGDTNFMAITGQTRVIPQDLNESYKMIKAAANDI